MNKELEKTTPLEHWKNFLLLVEAPAKARLLDCEWKDGLEQYDYFKAEIETALKDYEKLKAEYDRLESIYNHFIKQYNLLFKGHSHLLKLLKMVKDCVEVNEDMAGYRIRMKNEGSLSKEEYDLLKEVLL